MASHTLSNFIEENPRSSKKADRLHACLYQNQYQKSMANFGISLPDSGETPTAPLFIDGQKAATLRGQTIAAEFNTIVAEYIEKRFG